MALAAGTRLGPYEITAQIGIGGMGEVYRATDTDLGRDVAIKVLEGFAQDADRQARFEREAKTLAVLGLKRLIAAKRAKKMGACSRYSPRFVRSRGTIGVNAQFALGRSSHDA